MIDEKFTTCYTAVSRMLLRDVLEEQPLNVWQAELIVKSATEYKQYWDRENLEIARKIFKRLQEEKPKEG